MQLRAPNINDIYWRVQTREKYGQRTKVVLSQHQTEAGRLFPTCPTTRPANDSVLEVILRRKKGSF